MAGPVPIDYQPPAFPSLNNAFFEPVRQADYYLYYIHDIWRFTLLWTLILYGSVHLAVALCAAAVQWRNWRVIWIAPLVYVVSGGLEALLAGSIVGLILGATYESGNLAMSTWIPFIWAWINVLVLILSGFPIQGAL